MYDGRWIVVFMMLVSLMVMAMLLPIVYFWIEKKYKKRIKK